MSSSSSSSSSSSATAAAAAAAAAKKAAAQQKVAKHRQATLSVVNRPAQSSLAAQHSATARLHKEEALLCPVALSAALPELPVEQRFVSFPFDEDFHTAFDQLHGVSAEAAAPRLLHPEPDLGEGLALVNEQAYALPAAGAAPRLHPLDAAICDERLAQPPARRAGADAVAPEKIEWLMNSQHLHNDLYDAVYKHGDVVETQRKHLEKKREQIAGQLAARGSRKQRIEASFRSGDAAVPPHPTMPKLAAVRTWELLPDPGAGGLHLCAVSFDADPGEGDKGYGASAAGAGAGAGAGAAAAGKRRAAAPVPAAAKRARLQAIATAERSRPLAANGRLGGPRRRHRRR